MHNNQSNDETSTRLDVVITLVGGKQLVVDVSPLQKLLTFDVFKDPAEIGTRLQTAMDNMVVYRLDEGSISDLRDDYDFLCAVRNAFCEMKWKEVKGE